MKCPFCAEDVQDGARKCKHCGEWLDGSSSKTASPVEAIPLEPKNVDGRKRGTWTIIAAAVAVVILAGAVWGFSTNRGPSGPERVWQSYQSALAVNDGALAATYWDFKEVAKFFEAYGVSEQEFVRDWIETANDGKMGRSDGSPTRVEVGDSVAALYFEDKIVHMRLTRGDWKIVRTESIE